jgi:hypothetical protein
MKIKLLDIKENKVTNFDCLFDSDTELWELQYLGDGTQGFFYSLQDAMNWLTDNFGYKEQV